MLKLGAFHAQAVSAIRCRHSPGDATYRHEHQANSYNWKVVKGFDNILSMYVGNMKLSLVSHLLNFLIEL